LGFLFFKVTQPLLVSTVQRLYTVKEKGRKPDRKTYPLPNVLRNLCRNPKSENSSRLCPEISTKLYVRGFGFCKAEKNKWLIECKLINSSATKFNEFFLFQSQEKTTVEKEICKPV
jgi:hypothetical protein